MKKIYIKFHNSGSVNHKGTDNGRKYERLQVKHFSKTRVYLHVIQNGIPMHEMIKKMNFENKEVFIKFGKKKVVIGEYKEA